MSDKLARQIGVELDLLNQLLEAHRPLLLKCEQETPSSIELSALAALLHSFYGGVENIFKRVAREMDQDVPSGGNWHR